MIDPTILTAIVYRLGALFTLIISFYFLASYIRTRDKLILYLFICFFLVCLQGTLPFLIAFKIVTDPIIMSYIHVVSSSLLFMTLLFGIEILFFLTGKYFHRFEADVMSMALLVICLFVILVLILNPQPPTLSDMGMIYWNAYPLANYVMLIVAAVYGIIWLTLFYKASTAVEDLYPKAKLVLIGIDGFTFGIVGILAHLSQSYIQSLISHVLFSVVGIISFIFFTFPKFSTKILRIFSKI
jgi:hypothetical protein